jgi:hypothetical protein
MTHKIVSHVINMVCGACHIEAELQRKRHRPLPEEGNYWHLSCDCMLQGVRSAQHECCYGSILSLTGHGQHTHSVCRESRWQI